MDRLHAVPNSGVVVVLLCCVVLWCGVLCCGECYHLFMFGNGFPSRFVHFSFVASLSFRVWPAEVHRITGAGRQSPEADRTHHRNPCPQ